MFESCYRYDVLIEVDFRSNNVFVNLLTAGIDCGEPKGVRFGVIDTHKGLLYPSLGMYSCFEGHQLMDGNQVIMCTDNGEWFGEVPFCQGTYCT